MIKCANCDKKADYTRADPGSTPVSYCAACLPQWLRTRASLGHFPLVEPVVEPTASVVQEEAPKPTQTPKKKAAPKE